MVILWEETLNFAGACIVLPKQNNPSEFPNVEFGVASDDFIKL